jgi:hypothetical protein
MSKGTVTSLAYEKRTMPLQWRWNDSNLEERSLISRKVATMNTEGGSKMGEYVLYF